MKRMPHVDYLQEHFLDRRKCMNCGNYRNWQEMPVCPCGWPRFKDFDFPVLKEDGDALGDNYQD